MTPRLLLNSTKTKDYARNAREEEVCGVCVCVLFSTPFYFIAGSHQPQHPKPTLWANREAPRALVEAVGPTGLAGRPGRSIGLPGPPTAPIFFQRAVLGLLLSECWGLPCLHLFWCGFWATLGPNEPESSLWYFLWFYVGPKCACNLHISLKTQLAYSKRKSVV